MSRVDIVGLAKQSAFGTKQTVMEHFPPEVSMDVTDNRSTLAIEETIGSRFPTGQDYGTRYFDLKMQGALRPASLPRVKSGFMGAPVTTAYAAGDAGSYQHVFDPTLGGAAPVAHSIFAVRKDPATPIVDLFFDGIGNTFTETYAPNAYVMGEWDWITLDLDDTQAAPTPSRDTSPRWKFSQVVVYVNLNGAGEAAVKCAEASVAYNNNLDVDEAVLGSRKLYALPVGNADCQITFSPREALNSYYREALKADPTTSSLRIVATGPAISTTSKFFTVETTIPAFEITDAPATIDASTVLKMVQVTGRCKLDDISGKFVTQSVTNATASY
jgi:hypothetical protein